MLTAEEQMELNILRRHCAGIRELARATGHSRNTVGRYLREGRIGSCLQTEARNARRNWTRLRITSMRVCLQPRLRQHCPKSAHVSQNERLENAPVAALR